MKHPVVHVCIDPQLRFLARLKPLRAERYVRDLRAFADALWEKGIPTVWVAYCGKVIQLGKRQIQITRPNGIFHGFADDVTLRLKEGERTPIPTDALIDMCDLAAVTPRPYEPIVIKSAEDGFEPSPVLRRPSALETLLLNWETEAGIFSGLNTQACFVKTQDGCAQRLPHVRRFVAYDLLADEFTDAADDGNPLWHAFAMRVMHDLPNAYESYSAQGILRLLDEPGGLAKPRSRKRRREKIFCRPVSPG